MNRKINHIHERALRIVYNDYTTTFDDLLRKDKSVSIHHRNIQYVAIEMYKVVNNISPLFVREIFEKNDMLLTRLGSDFVRPKVNSVYMGDNSLRIFGPIVWNNMIPAQYKSCSSLIEFKRAIKSWIPDNCPCRLCKRFVTGVGFM